ncbi:MAG: alanine--tRNA ligase [Phycisphaerales bacterium]|nr:alanine--tRNA ligase [Phycisphaerales bacterium]
MTSSEIRRQFIDFFKDRHGHTFVPSSPVVPHDDPTLLFTNAGMNQFKPIFLGTERRAYTRAVNTQKCIRAGGKHNDLDDVGRSRRHHTFFEMLGNWSFGDYFKRDAIAWSWELLTKVWGLDPTRLHVTVHAGDPAIGVPRDDEAASIWRDVCGVPADRIHYGNTKDNFWEMGETGPCGPCTEIFVDRTPDKTGGPTVLSGEDPRVMEIWNNVFIQYNRNPDKSLTVLPAQHVDTGMGLERIIQVLQGKDDNYGIDLFDPFWAKLTELSGITYGGRYPKSNSADPAAEAADAGLRHDIAFRVIADHIRCLTFALTDGADPSNEGRGYVLRRILRRAVRFGRQQLELKDPFLHKLVPVVVDAMGDAFPELKANPGRVVEVIKDEEVSFGRTLDRGIKLFDEYSIEAAGREYGKLSGWNLFAWERTADMNPSGGEVSGSTRWRLGFERQLDDRESKFITSEEVLSDLQGQNRSLGTLRASDAFKLHDTYGFPIDLTRVMAEERGMSVDLAGYEKLMEEARDLARSGGKETDTRIFDLPPDTIARLQNFGIAPTDDSAKFNAMPVGATVRAIWDGHKLLDVTHGPEAAGQNVAVILDKTCFYAEMGGQVGDTGELRGKGGAVMDVATTRAVGGYVLHVGKMLDGHLNVGDHVTATLAGVRPRTEQNHTTTHLANWALREVLGEGVQQKGSLVDPDRLRFDFSHAKALTEDEVARVEQLVNDAVAKALPVYAEEAPQEQALKINGLRAVFGEKYPPMVRVVSVGVPVKELLADPGNAAWRGYSVEFCGGTHVKSSAEAGAFVVAAEESVSKGIRRITAHTGTAAKQVTEADAAFDAVIAKARQTPEAELAAVLADAQKTLSGASLSLRGRRRAQAAITELQAKLKAWEKAQKQSSTAALDVASVAEGLLAAATPIGAGKLVVGEVPGAAGDQLLAVVDSLRKRTGSYAVLLGAAADGKVGFVTAVSDDLIAAGLKAGDWIREAAKAAGGGGGGRPQLAQAGGKDPAKLPDALAAGRAYAAKFGG